MVLTVVGVDDLEVFDGGLSDSPVEVQHERVCLLVPARSFVHQRHQFVSAVAAVTRQKSLELLKKETVSLKKRFKRRRYSQRVGLVDVHFSDEWTLCRRSPASQE